MLPPLHNARLYCILDLGYTPEARAEQVTASLLAGGADILQLRAKNHDLATIERVARRLLPLCRAAGVPFILNDHPALAAALGADGVHIGQDDGSLAEARELYLSSSPPFLSFFSIVSFSFAFLNSFSFCFHIFNSISITFFLSFFLSSSLIATILHPPIN